MGIKTECFFQKNRLDRRFAGVCLIYVSMAPLVGTGLMERFYFLYLYVGGPVFCLFFLGRFFYKMRRGNICWFYPVYFAMLLFWWLFNVIKPDIWLLK